MIVESLMTAEGVSPPHKLSRSIKPMVKALMMCFVAVFCSFSLCVSGQELKSIETLNNYVAETERINIEAYGNQIANYTGGYLQINSTANTKTLGTFETSTNFNNAAGSTDGLCIGPGCKIHIGERTYDVNNPESETTSTINRMISVADAEMRSFGNILPCSTESEILKASGKFFQTQTVDIVVQGPVGEGNSSKATYNRTQTINLSVGEQ